jgi:hypothetical protein
VNRTVSRRLERLEARAATVPRTLCCRIRFVDPVEGLKSVLVLDSNGSREEPGTLEEKEQIRAEMEERRAHRNS